MAINKIKLIIANCKDTTNYTICKGKTYFYKNRSIDNCRRKINSKKIIPKQMKSQKFTYLC